MYRNETLNLKLFFELWEKQNVEGMIEWDKNGRNQFINKFIDSEMKN